MEESSELPAASEGRSSEACPSGLSVVLQPGDSVFVTSPGFPNHYPANARCSWSFEVKKTLLITLTGAENSTEVEMFGRSQAGRGPWSSR